MTRQLVWIDTEKERVVPVEPTDSMRIEGGRELRSANVNAVWSNVSGLALDVFRVMLTAAPPSTPFSLPSEEEFCEFWAREIDELDFNTLPETDKDRVDGLGACKDDYREYYRAIRKLLTEAQAQVEVMRGGLDSALAGIDGLRAAIDAGDPKAELLVRVGDVRRIVSASLSTPPTAVARVIEAARELEPHLDGLICYASTTSEHEPNRLVLNLRNALAGETLAGLSFS